MSSDTMRTPSLICCYFLLIGADSLACLSDPLGSHATVFELVTDSSSIVLATVESEKPLVDSERSEYAFSVKEILMGRVREAFTLEGYNPTPLSAYNSDYDAHSDPGFWASTRGNSVLDGACGIYGIFEIGKTYLIILGGQPQFKAFENIQSDEDLWLRVIRAAIDQFEK